MAEAASNRFDRPLEAFVSVVDGRLYCPEDHDPPRVLSQWWESCGRKWIGQVTDDGVIVMAYTGETDDGESDFTAYCDQHGEILLPAGVDFDYL